MKRTFRVEGELYFEGTVTFDDNLLEEFSETCFPVTAQDLAKHIVERCEVHGDSFIEGIAEEYEIEDNESFLGNVEAEEIV